MTFAWVRRFQWRRCAATNCYASGALWLQVNRLNFLGLNQLTLTPTVMNSLLVVILEALSSFHSVTLLCLQWRVGHPDRLWAFGLVGGGLWVSSVPNRWSDYILATTGAIAHLDALGYDPLGPWDALICSSTAGAAVAQTLLDSRLEQLRQRFCFDLQGPIAESSAACYPPAD